MKQLTTKLTAFVALLAMLFTSCEKEPPTKPEESKNLEIVLNNHYLPAAKVDSAVALWEVGGVVLRAKLQLTGNKLTTSLANFSTGPGLLTVQLFSQVKVDGQPVQWENRLTRTLNRKQAIVLAAPTSLDDAAWNPRAHFHFNDPMGSKFSALVALRPSDPYFELKGVAPYYARRIEIVRSFHIRGTRALVASRGWVCGASCLDAKGNLVNREHFLNLLEQIEGLDWDEYHINATFYVNSNRDDSYGFGLLLNKP